jgi:Ca-activated chloride channel family protein
MFHPVRSTSCLAFLFLLTFVKSYSQTSIDDVHVAPRGVELASALPVARAVIRTSADLVLVPVTITDGFDRPVMGLDQDNFQLYEDKKRQQIKHFSSEDTPVSIGLIVDMSGSMKDKLERTKEAIQQFCEASNPQDEFFMITFSDAPRLATDFTNHSGELENDLLTSASKGRTSLLDAIYMGLRKMKDARYPRRALLILSDGGDNHSRYSERDVRSAVKEAEVLLYAVGTYDQYVNTQEELLGPELLRSITEGTGGKAYAVTDVRILPAVTKAIGEQLRHQYVLAYQPQTKPHNGKWYKINVKLRLPKSLHAFLRVNARNGYYASSE